MPNGNLSKTILEEGSFLPSEWFPPFPIVFQELRQEDRVWILILPGVKSDTQINRSNLGLHYLIYGETSGTNACIYFTERWIPFDELIHPAASYDNEEEQRKIIAGCHSSNDPTLDHPNLVYTSRRLALLN